VYAYWSHVNESIWRLDDDQVVSAKCVLESFNGTATETIPITPEPGISTIAFALKEPIDSYGGKTAELAMDSTCESRLPFAMIITYVTLGKTNAAAYELYGFFGEANGRSLPLGFIFTAMTDGSATEHAKQRMLAESLTWLVKRCPNIVFTHSDKDPSEINACRQEIPRAKHQLCYYHAITYIEERLTEDKPPAAYDPRKANKSFSFIDPTWAPGVTRGEVAEYMDGCDMETGPDKQGGVRKRLEDIRQVSTSSQEAVISY
jgi:MULE transposase domain